MTYFFVPRTFVRFKTPKWLPLAKEMAWNFVETQPRSSVVEPSLQVDLKRNLHFAKKDVVVCVCYCQTRRMPTWSCSVWNGKENEQVQNTNNVKHFKIYPHGIQNRPIVCTWSRLRVRGLNLWFWKEWSRSRKQNNIPANSRRIILQCQWVWLQVFLPGVLNAKWILSLKFLFNLSGPLNVCKNSWRRKETESKIDCLWPDCFVHLTELLFFKIFHIFEWQLHSLRTKRRYFGVTVSFCDFYTDIGQILPFWTSRTNLRPFPLFLPVWKTVV